MLLTPWLKLFAVRLSRVFLGRRRTAASRSLQSVRVAPRTTPALSFERLEDRTLLATFTVNSAADADTADAFLTLREAIEVVNDGDHTNGVAGLTGNRMLSAGELAQIDFTNPLGTNDTINFDAAAVNADNAIVLGGTELSVTAGLTINGNGPDSTVINGGGTSRLFNITGGTFDVTFSNLTLTNGRVNAAGADGGGIRSTASGGTITIVSSVVSSNNAFGGGANYGGGVYSENQNVTVNDSLIRNNRTYLRGGGIFAFDATVTVTNSELINNDADSGDGGAVFVRGIGNSVIVNDSAFTNNEAAGDGGAIRADGPVTITRSAVVGNEAQTGDGGGIWANSGNVTLTSSMLSGNTANDDGGGVYTYDGDITVTSSTLSGNTANDHGGGIYTYYGNITVSDSTISGNTANDYGGGIYAYDGDITVSDSTISGNTATTGHGGGIASPTTGNVTIINSTLSGNRVLGTPTYGGGAIYFDDGDLTVINSTITNNSANIGGGIGNYNDNAGETLTIHNSIIAGNTAATNPDFTAPGFAAANLRVRNSLIGDSSGTGLTPDPDAMTVNNPVQMNSFVGGAGVNLINAMLGALAFNGGPTQTHAPLAGSLALDSGDNVLAVDPTNGNAALTNDQRGPIFARIVNTTVDMGAYESQTIAIAGLIVDNASDVVDGNLAAGQRTLRELIDVANNNAGADTISFDAAINGTPILLALGQLNIGQDVTIQGNGQNETIIDGQSLTRIVNVDAAVSNATFDSLTLRNGSTTGVGNENGGAGLRWQGPGTLTLTNTWFTANRTYSFGAGLLAESGNVNISGSTFDLNDADREGGAIFIDSGNVSIDASAISGNTGREGGGIYIYGSNQSASTYVEITNSTISGNTADSEGGGVYIKGYNQSASTYVEITNSTISGNTAGQQGGGIYIDGYNESASTYVEITNSTISGNTAERDGGGVYIDGYNYAASTFVEITNSTITGNTAERDGGGVYIDGYNSSASTYVKITNSTISGNTAEQEGGGVFIEGYNNSASTYVEITNSTISGNTAERDGGGLYIYGYNYSAPTHIEITNSTITGNTADSDDSAGGEGGGIYNYNYGGDVELTLFNTIVAGNVKGTAAPTDSDIEFDNGGNLEAASANNLIGDPNTAGGLTNGPNNNIVGIGGGVIPIASILAPLADNGGPTLTHALVPGSLALNNGDNALAVDPTPAPLTSDQRGAPFVRIFDGTVDIGAFEAQPLSITDGVATITGTDGGDNFLYRVTTRLAIVNGLAYFMPMEVDLVQFDGGDGNDRFDLIGTAGDETALTRPEQVFLEHDSSHTGFDVTGVDMETVILDGNGGLDEVVMRDTVGNVDEKLFARPTINNAVLFANDGSYASSVFGFQVTTLFSDGNDFAKFFDSADVEIAIVRPGNASLSSGGLVTSVQSFERFYAQSLTGNDIANIFGTAATDFVTARNGFTVMTAGGQDLLFDSYATVNANGLQGDDLVRFNGGPGDDLLVATGTTASFTTGVSVINTNSFERLIADARTGVNDRAILTGTNGADGFAGSPDFGELTGLGFFHRTSRFDRITINGLGGVNTLTDNGINYILIQQGTWV